MKLGLILVVSCLLVGACGGRAPVAPQPKNYPHSEWLPKIKSGLYEEAYAMAMDASSKSFNGYYFLWYTAYEGKTEDLVANAPAIASNAFAWLVHHEQENQSLYTQNRGMARQLEAVKADVLLARGESEQARSLIKSFASEKDSPVFLSPGYCMGARIVAKAAYELEMHEEAFKSAYMSVLGACGMSDPHYEDALALMQKLNASDTFDKLSSRREVVGRLSKSCQYDQSALRAVEDFYSCWTKVSREAGIPDMVHYWERQLKEAQESRIASEQAQEEMRRAAAERAQYQEEHSEEDYSGWGIAKNVMEALNESVQTAATPPSTPQQLMDRLNWMNEMYEGKDSVSRTPSPSAGAESPSVATASGCPEDLSFIGNRLPRFSSAELNASRQQIVMTSVRGTIQSAKSQGYSALAAIDAAQKQANEHERTARQGAACAAEVDAWGTTDQEFLSRINNREYANVSCEGIRGACLCSAIMNKMGALNARALAGAMRCHYGNGSW